MQLLNWVFVIQTKVYVVQDIFSHLSANYTCMSSEINLLPEAALDQAAQALGFSDARDARAALARIAELEQLLTVDALTRLINRNGLPKALNRQIAIANRRNQENIGYYDYNSIHHVTFIFIDLDHFGRINKIFSDHIGDAALSGVGAALLAGRQEDEFCRKGGDELLAVSTHNSMSGAIVFGYRIKEMVRNVCVPVDVFSVTIDGVIEGLKIPEAEQAAIRTRFEQEGAAAILLDKGVILKTPDGYKLKLTASVGVTRVHPAEFPRLITEFNTEDTTSALGRVASLANEAARRAKENGRDQYQYQFPSTFARTAKILFQPSEPWSPLKKTPMPIDRRVMALAARPLTSGPVSVTTSFTF